MAEEYNMNEILNTLHKMRSFDREPLTSSGRHWRHSQLVLLVTKEMQASQVPHIVHGWSQLTHMDMQISHNIDWHFKSVCSSMSSASTFLQAHKNRHAPR